METEDVACKICFRPRYIHTQAEEAGEVNHQYSTGQLVPLEKARPKPPSQPPVVIANAVDVQLRGILIARGILSDADFAPHQPGQGTGGDLRTGDAQGTD